MASQRLLRLKAWPCRHATPQAIFNLGSGEQLASGGNDNLLYIWDRDGWHQQMHQFNIFTGCGSTLHLLRRLLGVRFRLIFLLHVVVEAVNISSFRTHTQVLVELSLHGVTSVH
ncbi:hypothetical protein Tco_1441934 [Tanacetum coccineum]